MTAKDQELMERYIYQVVRRLPKDQRNEVGLELQELISDMMEQSDSMEAVLTELGSPAEFAGRYRDDAHYLIGPEYFDTYLWFVKIVMLCTLIPILAVSVIEGVGEGISGSQADYTGMIINAAVYGLGKAISSCVISCVGVFGGVTLVFAILERQKVKLDLKKEWSVSDLGDNFAGGKSSWIPKYLAPVPHKKALINRGDTIAGIVFIVIFCMLLIFAPHFFSAVFNEDGAVVVIPLFNLEQWNMILPVFMISLLIGLVDEILRLVVGCYCRLVMLSSIICGILQIILSIIVLKVFPLWNPDFGTEIKMQLGKQMDKTFDFFANWDGNLVSNGILIFIIIITLEEIGMTIYKTLRYGV